MTATFLRSHLHSFWGNQFCGDKETTIESENVGCHLSRSSTSTSKTFGDENKEERQSYEKYEAADSLELFPKETPEKPDPTQDMMTAIVDEKLEAKLAKLWTHKWYHGCLPFEDIAGLLKSNGDFLVRELEPEAGGTAMACVTVKWDGTVRNHPVRYIKKAQVFTIDGVIKYPNVMDLVRYLFINKLTQAYKANENAASPSHERCAFGGTRFAHKSDTEATMGVNQ
ncbi:SH2 domain protein [Ancylostoma caninum]|uniref:SH2 domain protein n=1 Tax=Ancylostoma caninum TaxID=29170 RepID=A0A368G5H1_ANCCA|nr:SH2 domain protein [Ancylostoma caninum]